MESVAIFADVQNIYYTTRQAYSRNFNYNALWARTTADRRVEVAFAYATERGDEKQHQFQNILRAIGFTVKLKPYLTRADGTAKGDWDVGITIDVLDYAPVADVIVLLSGDGDFAELVKTIISRHKIRVEVYGVPPLTSKSLMNEATVFNPIEGDLLL